MSQINKYIQAVIAIITIVLLWTKATSIIYIVALGFILTHTKKAIDFGIHEFQQYLNTKTRGTFELKDYILFRIDCLYSRDKGFKAYLLLVCTIFLISTGGFFWYICTDSPLLESFWAAWTFIADAGTHTGESEISQRLISVGVTLGGMIIFALVIGIISEEVSSLMDGLRKGTSSVIAMNHTLILGHSDKLIPLIVQIALANKSLGGAPIVILSERDKEELEYHISSSGIELHDSEVIVRTGVPYLPADLKRVSAENARSIIVLSDRSHGNADMADVNAVRTVLCLTSINAPSEGHIVCEVSDIDNEELVKMVGKNSVETFVSHDIIGRLMIQCARERGLSLVLENLLGFDGDEFYIQEWPELVGCTFVELMYRFEAATVVGIVKHSSILPHHESGKLENTSSTSPITVTSGGGGMAHKTILLNPADDEVLEEGDEVIVIAEDDDTYKAVSEVLYSVDELHLKLISPIISLGSPKKILKRAEKLLFIGWRRDVRDMINELDNLCSAGSELVIFCALTVEERYKRLLAGEFDKDKLKNLQLTHLEGNSTNKKDLEKLQLEKFNSILILADEDYENAENMKNREVYADSRALSCLLIVRDIQKRRRKEKLIRRKSMMHNIPMDESHLKSISSMSDEIDDQRVAADTQNHCAIISEILDARTRPLIAIASATDYVTSNELLSMSLAMVAEQRQVYGILSEIFSSNGNRIFLRPVHWYIREGNQASFYDIMFLAKSCKHLAFGYKTAAGEIFINPRDKKTCIEWSQNDLLLIIAMNN